MVQERGPLMVEPGDMIYIGMIVGENARENDIPLSGEGKAPDQHAFPRRRHSIECAAALEPRTRAEYIDVDEYVQATPKNLRLRKKILDETVRKRSEKQRVIKFIEN